MHALVTNPAGFIGFHIGMPWLDRDDQEKGVHRFIERYLSHPSPRIHGAVSA